jgi:hypothetical protein
MDDDYSTGDLEIANLIAPEFRLFSKWNEERFEFKLGIEYYNANPFYTEKLEGSLDLFRTTRFYQADLIKRIKKINLQIKSINFDYHNNYALFICQK